MIKLRGVTFGRGTPLFQSLDADFDEGHLILLTGDSGSGKSTLMQLIAGFAPLDYTGAIRVAGQDLRGATMTEKARQVGMLFQIPQRQFTMGTLRKELIFSLENLQTDPAKIMEKIHYSCEVVGTSGFLDRPLSQLSGGELQKAALTVLLAMDPQVLLLDEPFSSIDPTSRQELIQVLAGLRDQGKTIIVSDHDFSDYREVVDDWLTLVDGELTHRDPMQLPRESSTQLDQGVTDIDFLAFQQVSYGYNAGKLLTSTDFTFEKGITTLTGANGSGKSTLIRAIAQRQKYQGKMLFNGKRLRRGRHLYQQLSVVVQDAQKQFVTMTVSEELAYSNHQRSDSRKLQREALDFLGLAEKQSLFQLSEGQKKMVQLISMLTMDIDFLLLDEPFSGLDQRSCDFFAQWLKQQAATQDFLVVSHRLAPLSGVSQHHVNLADKKLWKERSHESQLRLQHDLRHPVTDGGIIL